MLRRFAEILSTSRMLILKPNVKNRSGEDLGEIEELILDPEDGSVSSFILDARRSLGPGKRVALPGEMLTCGWTKALILDVDREILERILASEEVEAG